MKRQKRKNGKPNTLNLSLQEDQATKKGTVSRFWNLTLAGKSLLITAAITIAVIGGLCCLIASQQTEPVIVINVNITNNISNEVKAGPHTVVESLTEESYLDISGVDLKKFVPNYNLSSTVITKCQDESGRLGTIAKAVYRKGDKELFAVISDLESPAPAPLSESSLQVYKTITYQAIFLEEESRYMAAWEEAGQYYYIEASSLTEKEFKKILARIWKNR